MSEVCASRFDSVEIKGLILSCGAGFRYITSYNSLLQRGREHKREGGGKADKVMRKQEKKAPLTDSFPLIPQCILCECMREREAEPPVCKR